MTSAAQPIKTLAAARAEIARLRALYESNPLQVSGVAHKHGCGYFNRAFGDPAPLITEAMDALRGVEFDTFVGTGLSGSLVAPLLARAMGRHFMIVRKEGDGSHSGFKVEGTIGSRWIFVDDFICSATTLYRCVDAINALGISAGCEGVLCYQKYNPSNVPGAPTHISIFDKELPPR